jgi:hypothetical protein
LPETETDNLRIQASKQASRVVEVDEWRPGYRYVFLMPRENASALGLRILPVRLREMGATVLNAPRSWEHFIYALMGGPYFRIDFVMRGNVGIIENRWSMVNGEREKAHAATRATLKGLACAKQRLTRSC